MGTLCSFSLSEFVVFKYRENVIEEVAKVNMVQHILSSPSTTRRGGTLDFISSKEMINSLRFLY